MKINIDLLKQNDKNSRNIDYFKLEQLKKSIKEFPEMLTIRPIVVNRDYIIIGGNMRWQAAKEIGMTEIDIIIIEDEDREYEFMIKDNTTFGDWNWEGLNGSYNDKELLGWGIDVPLFFRTQDEELENTNDIKNNLPENIINKKEDIKKNIKKALYLFFTQDEKKDFSKIIKSKKGELSNEQYILEVIKKNID